MAIHRATATRIGVFPLLFWTVPSAKIHEVSCDHRDPALTASLFHGASFYPRGWTDWNGKKKPRNRRQRNRRLYAARKTGTPVYAWGVTGGYVRVLQFADPAFPGQRLNHGGDLSASEFRDPMANLGNGISFFPSGRAGLCPSTSPCAGQLFDL